MLEKPIHGWSHISIASWNDRCSYLDDVPVMLFEALEQAVATGRPVAVELDAEGYEYTIVFNSYAVFIITGTDEGYSLTVCEDIRLNNLLWKLAEDVRRDIDDWVSWGYEDLEVTQMNERRTMLLAHCENATHFGR
jgi:hypothetical protein